VAIDTDVRADGSKRTRVRQPLPMPEGVPDTAVGGGGMGAGMLGVLGTKGTGSGGGGVGYGHGVGTLGSSGRVGGLASKRVRGAVRPRVGAAMVTGSIDRSVIQKVIRRHLKRIKLCYENGLKRNPKLHGRVEVRLTIGADGKVTKAEIAKSTLNDKQVEQNILKVMKRIRFPRPPGGGSVTVSYPFIFSR